jgi:hypothetical protein
MAAAFPGLQDRLEQCTSAPVIRPAGAVEVEKLDDEEAEAPIPPSVVGKDDDVAEGTLPELVIVEKPFADESTVLVATERALGDD